MSSKTAWVVAVLGLTIISGWLAIQDQTGFAVAVLIMACLVNTKEDK